VRKLPGRSVIQFFVLWSFFLASVADAGDFKISTGLGIEFATGDYGTGTTTDSLAIPLTIDVYPTNRLECELVIPFLYQSNSFTTSAGGVRFGRNGSGGVFLGNGANGNGLGGSFARTIFVSDANRSQSGLGNISLKSGYVILEEGKVAPQVKPILYLEFPTADRDKGLGTGEFVTGLGVAVDKWFGSWQAYLEGIYNFQGSSDLYALKDFLAYEVGLGYQVSDRFLANLALLGATRPVEGASDLLEARVKMAYRLSAKSRIEGYLAAGLTNGSPDFGTGVAVFYAF
jgi:hypothetical protein